MDTAAATSTPAPASEELFNSLAWKNAWLSVWGKQVQLFDPLGQGNPHQMFYGGWARLAGCLPVYQLAPVGVQSPMLSSPRAEYVEFDAQALAAILQTKNWQRLTLSDLSEASVKSLKDLSGHTLYCQASEPAYQISADTFESYKAGLSANSRRRYFNKRNQLAALGKIAWIDYRPEDAELFFTRLNQFHVLRWGRPCYSRQSQQFYLQLLKNLEGESAFPRFTVLELNKAPVALVFDLCFGSRRYNIQLGFDESIAPNIALGSIALGYCIEDALDAGYEYDLLAGRGKKENYKAAIATKTRRLQTVKLERGWLGLLRKLKTGSAR